MNTLRFSLLLSLLSCGKGDDDPATDPEVGDPCDAEFTLTLADGSEFPMDDCKHHGVELEFASMPDTTLPQPHNISFIFRSTKDTSVNCWVRWEVQGSCPGRTQYDLGGEDSQLTWNTTDCAIDPAAQGEYVATFGSSEFTAMSTAPISGLEEGSPMAIAFSADVSATAEDGSQLEGTVVVDDEIPLVYTSFEGCSGSDGDTDQDGSIGTQYGGDDCDDEDPSIGPHAVEVCDEIDNNCDGNVDEGVTTTHYKDDDGDGYGRDDAPVEACTTPEGYAPYAGDCDDTDASTNPSQTEVCDGVDNDCDDVEDEGTKIAIYTDDDGDGYGEDPPVDTSCPDAVPAGFSAEGLDCDDDDPFVHPGAEEVCDGVDNDCNDAVDELPTCG